MTDHIHLLMGLSLPDKYSSLIRDLKTNSSIWINQHHPCDWRFAWQEGYGSFSLSHSGIAQIKDYINNQAEHHKKWSFEDEFLKLLEMHSIQFDDRFVLG